MERLPKAPTTKAPADSFTGDVYVDATLRGVEPSRIRVYKVRFTPGARTAWHKHTCGQTLHATDGVGLVVTAEKVIVLREGDTVWTPPDEWHWHGAAPENFMAHLAMWEGPDPALDLLETVWGEHVTDTEYAAASALI
ncbi:MAG: cupin domain-containing protein [Micropruina sp.]